MLDPERRRRRIRHLPAEPAVEPDAAAVEIPAGVPVVTEAEAAADREAERGLRGLVGSGASQVGTGAAMRARDAARVTDADLAAAEANLLIVRRGWVPRDDLPRSGPR